MQKTLDSPSATRRKHKATSDSIVETQCQCNIANVQSGWTFCERHKILKTPHWIRLCQNNPDYWQAWEEGRGPGQVHEPLPKQTKRPAAGPGTELKKLLGKIGIVERNGCKCRDMAVKMDRWGPDGCEQHMDKILEHLKVQAAKRNLGIVYNQWVAEKLVRHAIRRSRKRGK